MTQQLDMEWLFIDLETTGLNPEICRITEIAAIRRSTSDGARCEFQSLVNPGIAIDPFIQRLTGITNDMVASAPALEVLRPEVAELLDGAYLVAHNAGFDAGFLEIGLGIKIPRAHIVDTIELAKILYPNFSSYSLKNLVRQFNLKGTPSHRAMADTEALEQLFFYLVRQAQSLPIKLLSGIVQCLGDEQQGLSRLFQQLLYGRRLLWDQEDSIPDGSLLNGKQLEEERLLEAWQKSGWGLPATSQPKQSPSWDPKALERMLQKGGMLDQGMDHFQSRPQQIEMLRAVARSLANSRCLMVEAGTGVGKSLAYLIPALSWAVSQEEKVVAATHTIALQEQLFHKEIEFLHRALPFEFQCAVLKGRGNYLCLSRWREVVEEGKNLFWGERVLLARICVWLQHSASGDMDSIQLLGPERDWFSQMASSRETCKGSQCLYYRDCFYQKARQQAAAADLIIVNHSLLLADAKLGEAVLPKYQYLIVDEAHHLEEEGTKQFTETFSLLDFEKKVQMLHKRRDVFGRPGFLHYIKEWRKQGIGEVEALSPLLEELAVAVRHALKRINSMQNYLTGGTGPDMLRISRQTVSESWWQNVHALLDNLKVAAMSLEDTAGKISRYLQGDGGKVFDESWLKMQLQLFMSVQADAGLLAKFLKGAQYWGRIQADETAVAAEDWEQQVLWLRRDSRANDLTLCITPINTAGCFQQYLFENKESVILTSATLSVKGDFSFCSEQLGIDPEWLDTKLLQSPFDYREQVLMLSDTSLPDPARTSETVYNLALMESLGQTLEACGGRTMVLFTSHRQLRTMYDGLSASMLAKGLEIYADGINGSRFTLLEELKTNEHAILFGANTFWEGIDLPGLALTSLIIVRLPFAPPGQPLVEARMEQLSRQGLDPFYHYSLPLAVLRFRQGYGRLIRSIDDWGVVVVLDNRIVNKRYGKVFLQSLPDPTCLTGRTQELSARIRDWQKRFWAP